jgi:8-oxo-dGTP pyrophosphatase MutT (NUDIX family)
LKKWRVVESHNIHRDRWLSVRADNCVTASGVSLNPYYVLEYPDFVHTVAIDGTGQILFVRQYRHGFGGASLELPGGLIDQNDPNPVTAAARELLEETGYAGEPGRLIASLSVDPAKIANRLHLVLIQGAKLVAAPSFDEGESIEVQRAPPAEAVRLARDGQIVNASHVGLLWLGLDAAGLL